MQQIEKVALRVNVGQIREKDLMGMHKTMNESPWVGGYYTKFSVGRFGTR